MLALPISVWAASEGFDTLGFHCITSGSIPVKY